MESDYEIIQISDRPGFHSYFDVFPESPDGERVVYFAPELGDPARTSPAGPPLFEGDIVVTDSTGKAHRVVGHKTLGNRQAGPRQQWLDNDTVAYAMADGDTPQTACVSVRTGELFTLPGAIRMANPLGKRESLTSSHEARAAGFDTTEEAVYLQDFQKKECRRLFDVEEALACHPMREEIRHPEQLQFKHTKWAPSGDRFFVVFHHQHFLRDNPDADIRIKSLMVASSDGSDLHYASEFGGHPFWSSNDRTIYAFEQQSGERHMMAHPADGGTPEQYYSGVRANHASLSPDGGLLAMDCFNTPQDGMISVWVANLESGEEEQLAAFDAPDMSGTTGTHPHPVWSRDGQHIYFNVAEDNVPYLYKVKSPWQG